MHLYHWKLLPACILAEVRQLSFWLNYVSLEIKLLESRQVKIHYCYQPGLKKKLGYVDGVDHFNGRLGLEMTIDSINLRDRLLGIMYTADCRALIIN